MLELEHRRYSHALSLFYKCLYDMGPNNIKEMSLFRNNEYDLEASRLPELSLIVTFVHNLDSIQLDSS